MKKMFKLIFLFILFYFLYCLIAMTIIIFDIRYRQEHIIYSSFYDFDYTHGKVMKMRDFENVDDYDIKFKIKFCVSIFGITKGKVFYIYTKEVYKNNALNNGSWNVPVTLTVQRNGFFSWKIIKVNEAP
jgi:hypothetical protein